MKTLITTTALALVLAAPVAAQTAGGQQGGGATLQPGTPEDRATGARLAGGMEQGFYAGMQQGDLRASELMDATIYASQGGAAAGTGAGGTTGTGAGMGAGQQAGGTATMGEDGAMPGETGSRWGRTMTMQDLESMEQIGRVQDLVLDEQGRVLAILVDVGGFLGVDARQVALGLHQVNFVTDTEDPSRIYVVSMIGTDALETAPEFDETIRRDMASAGRGEGMAEGEGMAAGEGGLDPWRAGRDPLVAPDIQREGYQRTEANRMSVDDLLGAAVYDARDEDVGDISDVVLGPNGEAQYVVVDVGGFLGIGEHTVAIGFDEMTVMQGQDMTDLRVYVDVTEETLESMPEHTRD